MKKFLAYAGSALFCPLVFLPAFIINLRLLQLLAIPLYYIAFPLAMALYFLIAGRLFRPLGIGRWSLWLVMNLIGYPLCWVGVAIMMPALLFNGGIVLFFLPVTAALVLMWLVVGAGFLLLRLVKTPPVKIVGSLRRLFSRIVSVAKPLLLTLAVIGIGSAGYRMITIRPASDYTDEGVYTFVASQSYPTVESTYRSGSSYRSRQRTVYKVVYQAQGAGYTYTQEAPTESIGKQYVREKRSVERRVLSITGENLYITVDAGYTPEGYVQSLRTRYLLVFGLSAGYLAALAVWYIWKKRAEEEQAAYG